MSEYIICYDISDPKRLQRIHRHLTQHAIALQYSVFLFNGTEQQLEHCIDALQAIMDPCDDDIRAYPLPQRGLRYSIGKALLPYGIQWSGLPLPWSKEN